jgi:hypothetical protein
MMYQVKVIMERMVGITPTHNHKKGKIIKRIREMMIQIKVMTSKKTRKRRRVKIKNKKMWRRQQKKKKKKKKKTIHIKDSTSKTITFTTFRPIGLTKLTSKTMFNPLVASGEK